jgi:hypothetical protein
MTSPNFSAEIFEKNFLNLVTLKNFHIFIDVNKVQLHPGTYFIEELYRTSDFGFSAV